MGKLLLLQLWIRQWRTRWCIRIINLSQKVQNCSSGGLDEPGRCLEDATNSVADRGEGRVEENNPEAAEDGEKRLDNPHHWADDPHVEDGQQAEEQSPEDGERCCQKGGEDAISP